MGLRRDVLHLPHSIYHLFSVYTKYMHNIMTKLCKVLVYRYTYLNIGVLSSMEHIFQLPIEIFKWEA